nr:hypothetical protein [Algoriphagus locisalis]
MKEKLTILILMAVNLCYAQGVEVKEQKESSFFDLPIEDVLGIIDFDLEVLAKRIHVKNQSPEYKKLERIVSWYSDKTDSLFDLKKVELEGIEYAYHRNVAGIKDRNDFDEVVSVVKNYLGEVKPYTPPFQAVEHQLSNWVAGFLNEKQYSKWETYLSKQHKKMKPKSPMPMSGPPTEFF